MLVMYIEIFLCVLLLHTCVNSYKFIFYSGSKWLNICYQYDGNCVLHYLIFYII